MQQVFRKCLFLTLFLVIPVLLAGCGGGGGGTPTSNVISTVTFSNGAVLKVISTGNSTYVIQGDTLAGVAGIDLTLTYDSATKASPTVTQGDLVSGALMVANTASAGSIRIAIVKSQAISGTGTVAAVTFATDSSPGGITLSATMIDVNGRPL